VLKWLKRRAKEEEPAYCGFILMQSEWYKKQVEDGMIDHTNCSVTVYRKEQLAQLEAQGYKNVKYVDLSTPIDKTPFRSSWRDWFERHL
jgi:hypothetical protein